MDYDDASTVKFIYSEKVTKFEKNLPTYLTLTSKHQNKWEIFSKFCGLLRISELYLIELEDDQNTMSIWTQFKTARPV